VAEVGGLEYKILPLGNQMEKSKKWIQWVEGQGSVV